MKWLRIAVASILIGAVLPLIVTPPAPAMAATTADVLVTATPGLGVPGTPTGFTLVDLGAITVTGNWTVTGNATHTMIRAARDTYPETTTEGELMYYGENTTANWTGFSLETTTYYFSAWSYNSGSGLYSLDYATASIGGEGMEGISESIENFTTLLTGSLENFVILLIILVPLIFFSIMAFWKENSLMFMLAGGVSILAGFCCYDVETNTWSLGISLVLWAYAIVCLIFGFMCMFKRSPAD